MSNERRGGIASPTTSQETAGRPEAVAFARSLSGNTEMRDLVVAGGLRGFTPDAMFPKAVAS